MLKCDYTRIACGRLGFEPHVRSLKQVITILPPNARQKVRVNGCPKSQKVWHANRILIAQWPWVMSICRSKFTSFHMQWWPRHIKQQTDCSSNKLWQITDKIVELKYVSNYFDLSHQRNPLICFSDFYSFRQNIQKYMCHTFTDLLSSCPCIYYYLLWN